MLFLFVCLMMSFTRLRSMTKTRTTGVVAVVAVVAVVYCCFNDVLH